MSSTPEVASSSKKTRRKNEKKQVIEINLWINGCKYEFGLLCTFCAKKPAVFHCPECTDFYCPTCDTTAHNTKKRKHHIRSKLSHLDKDNAARLVTRAVRRFGLIKQLQARCRQKYKRFFDRKTLTYYYFNTVYKTVSWRKPYCLRKQELFPFMTPEYAASKCQNLYHLWKAREKTRTQLVAQYTKIFDRRSGRFYYAFHGKSNLLSRSSWKRPRLLGKRSFPKDLKPIYTNDVAALIIQRKWRSLLIKQFFRALVRSSYDEVWDPIKGRYNYYHRETAVLHQEKPKLLGNEPWDPSRIPDWPVDRVSIFLRRIGLKQYVDTMKSYGVDGNALVLLDNEDFDNLGITNRLHIRKIRVEIDRIFDVKLQRKVVMSEAHEMRREKIRRQKMFHMAATKIQAQFRRYAAEKEVALLREMKRISIVEQFRQKIIEANSTWWTEKKTLPSRKFSQLPSIGSNGVKLPPIKSFGRSRDHLSHRGWVHRVETYQQYKSLQDINNSGTDYDRFMFAQYRGDFEVKSSDLGHRFGGNPTWVPTLAAQLDPNFQGESTPSLIFSEKLYRSGYDAKRMDRFLQSPT